MRHVRTDPACSRHRRPRGPLAHWWFDRHRGWSCPRCTGPDHREGGVSA